MIFKNNDRNNTIYRKDIEFFQIIGGKFMRDRERIFLNEYAKMINEGVYSKSEWRKYYELKAAINPFLFNRKLILDGQRYYPSGNDKREKEMYLRAQREHIIMAYIRLGIDYDEIVNRALNNHDNDFRGSYVDIE